MNAGKYPSAGDSWGFAHREKAIVAYIFELKVDLPPAIAMSQAERKDYAAPFVVANKPIWLVGLSFARETRKFVAGVAECYGG